MPGDAVDAASKSLYLEPLEKLNSVGVSLIEGDSPMNDACYAVLNTTPAVANLVAASLGAPYHFRFS